MDGWMELGYHGIGGGVGVGKCVHMFERGN